MTTLPSGVPDVGALVNITITGVRVMGLHSEAGCVRVMREGIERCVPLDLPGLTITRATPAPTAPTVERVADSTRLGFIRDLAVGNEIYLDRGPWVRVAAVADCLGPEHCPGVREAGTCRVITTHSLPPVVGEHAPRPLGTTHRCVDHSVYVVRDAS